MFEIPIAHFDKYVHFGLFCIHATLTSVALYPNQWIIRTSVFGTVLAGLTEVLQIFAPGRHADLMDFMADGLGIAIGVLFIYFVKKNE